ncbi:MAG: hypothetical protein ACIAQU_04270 [Phycisphaerales bacterium JB064]
MTNSSDVGVDGGPVIGPDPVGEIEPVEPKGTIGPRDPVGGLAQPDPSGIANGTWWGVLSPTSRGQLAWVEDGGQPCLYSEPGKAVMASKGLQGAHVCSVTLTPGPAFQSDG